MIKCINCYQSGHRYEYCPKLTCVNCGQNGHCFSVCPFERSYDVFYKKPGLLSRLKSWFRK